MPYAHTNSRGLTFYLHTREVTMRGGRKQKIYCFAKDIRSQPVDSLPEGYTVQEIPKTGMLFLKKK